ncbi:MAG: Fic family protein [Gammaproteobacteria bacterium]|nr:Fic family protein [Gammaproteobacteria bacterium]
MPIEPDNYPGTQVYINKLGITVAKTLAEAEATLTWARTEQYRDTPSPTGFDLSHLQHIHHHLFQDVYAWAGQLRSYDVKKQDCIFTPAADIERYAHQIYTQLADEGYLQGLARSAFLERLAYYYDMTNRLHPFPEGNGRTQRLFIEDLAALNDMLIDWAEVNSWEIIETAIQAFYGNREPIYRMLDRIISPLSN